MPRLLAASLIELYLSMARISSMPATICARAVTFLATRGLSLAVFAPCATIHAFNEDLLIGADRDPAVLHFIRPSPGICSCFGSAGSRMRPHQEGCIAEQTGTPESHSRHVDVVDHLDKRLRRAANEGRHRLSVRRAPQRTWASGPCRIVQ
jgi:hypothetical protein